MAKIRRVVRKPRSEQHGDVFEDQLWPTYIALVVLGAFSMGVSAAYKSFADPRWYNNALTYLILIPVVVGAFMLAIYLLDNRAWRRSMQFSAVLCAIIHLAFVVQMLETNLFGDPPQIVAESRRIERREPKPIPEYRPQQMLSAEERPQQDHEKPVETQTPEPTREPEEVIRQETPRDVAPPQQQPIPVPEVVPTTEPNVIRKPQPNEAAPKSAETPSKLSRQTKPADLKISQQLIQTPQVAQQSAQPSNVQPSAAPTERQTTSTNAAPREVKEPTTQADSPTASVAKRAEQRTPTTETTAQPTLQRSVARPTQTPRSQVAAVETPPQTRETTPQEIAPANTTSTKATNTSPSVARAQTEPLPEVATQSTPQPQRRQLDSPQQPTVAQTATPVPNRQPRTTERPDVKTQAAVVTPSPTAGQTAAREPTLTPQSASVQRATATVSATKPSEMPSAEPNTARTDQVASRITRTTGQSAPTATTAPTQTPTLTRNATAAPSVPSATRVETTAAAATQVATTGELSPTSTATQRTATAAAQQAPTSGQPRPTTVAANTSAPSTDSTSRRANSSNNPSDAPAVTPGTAQLATSRSTQPVRSNTVTNVADVPTNAGPQASSTAALGPSSASVSRQMTANTAGATRTQPTASTSVASPTAQVSHGGAARAQNSTTPTIDPTGTPGRSPSRAVATAAQATSPTNVDSPAQAIAAQGAGDPSAQPARMALSRGLGGVAGVGKSPNMDRSTPGSAGAAMVASSSARRAEASQQGPTGEALAPSATAQIARARAGAEAPTASLKAENIEHATSPGATEVAQLNASSSAALTRADADAKRGEVTGAKGSGEVDLGPTQIVAETGAGRAAGGGQAELNFETNAQEIARKTETGGSPLMSLASAKVAEEVAAPMGTSGGQPAATDPGPSAVSAARTLAGGAAPQSGGPSKASEHGPSAEVNSAAMLAESAVSRRDNAEGASGGAAGAGQPDLEDEKEKALRLARQAAGGAPQLAVAGPVVADVPQSPMGASGDGGAPNAAPQVVAVTTSTGRQNSDGGAPRGGAPIAAGDPGDASRGGAEQVGSVTVTRAEAADGTIGEPALGGGSASPTRQASGITIAANTQAETVELAGAPNSGGAPAGQSIAAQGTEAQRFAGGAAGPAATGPTGAMAGPQLVDAATVGLPGEAAGRRNASASTADGPQVGGEVSAGAPGRRAAVTEIAGSSATVADIPQMGPTSAVAQAELDHGMGNMGMGPMSRPAEGTMAVNIEAPDGPGGLGSEHAPKVGLNTRQARLESVQIQVQNARFLRQTAGGLPSVSTSVVISTDPFAKRNARDRGDMKAGGEGSPSPQTEAAVELGLQFLARYQQTDGRWSLQGFGEETQLSSDTAATALSLLAFQGAGYNHREHQYRDVVRSGLEFLLANQKENGDLFIALDDDSNRSVWLYSHALGAIALCEAYGMTQDPDLRVPAQKAIDFIVEAQNKELGGWRYAPGIGSDTSVSGWMMMALKSGELANLNVPKETYAKIEHWLNVAQKSGTEPHEFRYNPFAPDTPEQRHGLAPSKTMTSVGLLMRLYSGSTRDSQLMVQGADYLRKHLPAIGTPRNPERDTYYWYYGTQVMFHMGGDYWKAWNGKLHPLLVDSQIKQGPLAGSWQPRGPVPDRWSAHAGRLYVTTMNLLSLEVYHRHLPLYVDTLRSK